MSWEASEAAFIVGTPYIGATIPYHPGEGGYLGAFIAWGAARGRKVWEIRENYIPSISMRNCRIYNVNILINPDLGIKFFNIPEMHWR